MAARKCPIKLAADEGFGPLAMVAAGVYNNTLPYSGGTLEQPGLLMDAVNIYLDEKHSG